MCKRLDTEITERKMQWSPGLQTPDSGIQEGLKGVVITQSKISQVDGERGQLSYRGIDVVELAKHSTFEETVYLLWIGDLPKRAQLEKFKAELVEQRPIDEHIWGLLTHLPTRATPMDALRTAVSALACSDTDDGERTQAANVHTAIDLTAKLPTIVTTYYRHLNWQTPVDPDPALDHAANFLYMLHGKRPTEMKARIMDVVMLLMAEHGLNASTFAARVTASTLSDMYAAITSAVGTLKGRLHGGANRRAMEMLLEIGDAANAESYIDAALAEGRRIMGFGHRVYRHIADPRSHILRPMLHELCAETDNMALYELAVTVADLMEAKKGLYPNVDFYTAPLLYLLEIPLELFTPIFAISRVPGWTAQVMAQYENNRLLRPLAQYVGPINRPYVPMDQRM
ncbi:MAG: citrate/2-methylcitrate synthase [Anaerolineae bacterium]